LHLSVTVFEHVGRLLSSVDDAVADASGVAAGIALASGAGVAAGAVASGVAGGVAGIVASAGGVAGAGAASCAKAAVLSASADAKRIIFIVVVPPTVGRRVNRSRRGPNPVQHGRFHPAVEEIYAGDLVASPERG
jgi:hypothetical protein